LKEWNENFGNVYSEAADYSNEEFMHENSQHWMEGTSLLPIFARGYRLRVVLYVQQGESDRWQTHIYDGRAGQLDRETHDGVRVVEPQVPPLLVLFMMESITATYRLPTYPTTYDVDEVKIVSFISVHN
jgi:hypothetical protein